MTNGLEATSLTAADFAWRAAAREALQTEQYAALDALLAPHEHAWLEGDYPVPGIRWRLRNVHDPVFSLQQRLQHAQRWAHAMPGSAYAWLCLGECWSDVAGELRSADVAALVEDAQWLAAGLARDHALHAFLQAAQVSPRPALALAGIQRIAAYLGEPTWLHALQRGEPALPEADDLAAQYPQAWPQAVQLLAAYGAPLQHLPATLPALLQSRREADDEAPLAYWMRLALAERPGDLVVLENTLYFLYPRWGGSHEAMADFIDGPWCRPLSLAQCNALRWKKEQDWLPHYPDRDDADSLANHEEAYAQILDWHLGRQLRAEVLCQWAALHYYCGRVETQDGDVHWSAPRMQAAFDCLQQAWALDRDQVLQNGFTALEACAWFARVEGADALFAELVAYAMQEADTAVALLWAAVAVEHGLLGQDADPRQAQQLLQRALALAPQQHTSTVTFAGNLFWDVSKPIGAQLMQRLAEQGDASAMSGMCDLHLGRLAGRSTPSGYEDPEKAAYWQERAIEAGDLIATYNLAVRLAQRDAAEDHARASRLYLSCLQQAQPHERVWSPACRNLAVLAMERGDDAAKRAAIEQALVPLWWRGDNDDRLWAAGYLADIHHTGDGVPANAFLAATWLQRAAEMDPQYVDVVRLTPLINGEGRLFGASRARRQQERDRQQVDSHAWALTFGQHSHDSDLTAV